jgi:formylglycine-generating enzyme
MMRHVFEHRPPRSLSLSGIATLLLLLQAPACHDLDAIVPGPDAACDPSEIRVGNACLKQPPSCEDVARTCGPNRNESCCVYDLIDTRSDRNGGAFDRGWDRSDNPLQPPNNIPVVGWQRRGEAPATVSPFYLDRYEVTLGRFLTLYLRYQDYLQGIDLEARGAQVRGNRATTWRKVWEDPNLMSLTDTDLDAALRACEPQVINDLKDPTGSKDNHPMTCVNWYEALLFCIFDGGRLPTEAEWNFAAAGGSEQRPFPWSMDTVLTDRDGFASYANVDVGGQVFQPMDVGSFPQGRGRYGQYDLAGNATEWVFDRCGDCAKYAVPRGTDIVEIDVPGREADVNVITRGGSFRLDLASARTSYRRQAVSSAVGRYPDTGWRCARNGP